MEPEPDFLAGAGAGAVEITSAPGHHLQVTVKIFANYFFFQQFMTIIISLVKFSNFYTNLKKK